MKRPRGSAAILLMIASSALMMTRCANSLLDKVKVEDREYRASLVAPAAPGTPLVAGADAALNVSWPAVPGAKGYDVFWHTADDPASIPAANARRATEPQASIPGLVNYTLYYVWVRAFNDAGESALSPSAGGTPGALPATPGQPTLAAADGQLTVSWAAVSGATSYDLFWSEADDTASIPAANTANTTIRNYVITGLTNDRTYYVWLKARNAVGPSGFGPGASETPVKAVVPPAAPGKPAVKGSDASLSATWEAVEGATTYAVWYYTDSDTSRIPDNSKKTGLTELSYTISPVTNGVVWYVWIVARNDIGDSAPSEPYSVIPLETPDITGLVMGEGRFTVSWSESTGTDSYDILWSTENDSGSIPEANSMTDTESPATITGLAEGTRYYVWVRARNSGGQSDLSASMSGMTIPAVPAAPTVTAGEYRLAVSWDAVQGAESYDLYWSGSEDESTFTTSRMTNAAGTSTTISSLENGKEYFVRLKSKNSSGKSAFSAAASGVPFVHATSVQLEKTSATMTIGSPLPLAATVTPEDATDPSLTWKTSNSAVATVSSSGVVTAKAAGSAMITATSNDVGTLSASCAITVLSDACAITAFSFAGIASACEIDQAARTIAMTIPYEASEVIGTRTAVFTLSPGATAKVGTKAQVSGTTTNNFSSPVSYTITAENTLVTATYTVTTTMAPDGTGTILVPNPQVAVGFSNLPAQWAASGSAATVTATTSETVDSYQWYLDGLAVSGATASTFTISSARGLANGSHSLAVFVTKGSYSFSHEESFLVVKEIASRASDAPGLGGSDHA